MALSWVTQLESHFTQHKCLFTHPQATQRLGQHTAEKKQGQCRWHSHYLGCLKHQVLHSTAELAFLSAL